MSTENNDDIVVLDTLHVNGQEHFTTSWVTKPVTFHDFTHLPQGEKTSSKTFAAHGLEWQVAFYPGGYSKAFALLSDE